MCTCMVVISKPAAAASECLSDTFHDEQSWLLGERSVEMYTSLHLERAVNKHSGS